MRNHGLSVWSVNSKLQRSKSPNLKSIYNKRTKTKSYISGNCQATKILLQSTKRNQLFPPLLHLNQVSDAAEALERVQHLEKSLSDSKDTTKSLRDKLQALQDGISALLQYRFDVTPELDAQDDEITQLRSQKEGLAAQLQHLENGAPASEQVV